MYGFNETEEREVLKTATSAFLDHISSSLPDHVQKEDSPLIRMKVYLAHLKKENEQNSRTEFYKFLTEQHKSLLYDGSEWEQRPYDLLGNEDLRANEENKAQIEQDRDKLFQVLQCWELLTIAFASMRKVQADPSGLCDEKWKTELNKMEKAILDYENRLLPLRKSLDVFDNKISYYERMARQQEKLLPGTTGQHAESIKKDRVVLPYAMITEFRNNVKDNQWKDLIIFYAMVYRHLKALQVTAEQLKQRTDYWILPGGIQGLGTVQKNVTAKAFHDRVSEALRRTNKCASLMSFNGVVMVSMDPDVFQAYENADALETPEAGENDGDDSVEVVDLLSTFREKLKTSTCEVVADQVGNLFMTDNGTTKTADQLYQALELFNECKMTEEKNQQELIQLFLGEEDNLNRWTTAAKTEKYRCWDVLIRTYFDGLASKGTNGKRSVCSELHWMQSAKCGTKNAVRLLIGLAVFAQNNKKLEKKTKDELVKAVMKTISDDKEGKNYTVYRKELKEKPHNLRVDCEADKITVSIEDRVQSIVNMDVDQKALIGKVLTPDGNPTVTAEEFKDLKKLFDLSVSSVSGLRVGSGCNLMLDTALIQHQKRNRKVELQKIFLLVMQWKQKTDCTFEVEKGAVFFENSKTKFQPFQKVEDAQSFIKFLTQLKEGRVHRALGVKKTENGKYSARFKSVFPPLTAEEIAVLEAWEIGENENISKEAYRTRLAGIDLHVLNGLLKKASPYLESDLPDTISTKNLLDGRPRVKNRLPSMLLLVLLFRMHGSEQNLTFEGKMPTEAETFKFDLDSLQAFRAYLVKLLECRESKRTKNYRMTVNEQEEQGDFFDVEISA